VPLAPSEKHPTEISAILRQGQPGLSSADEIPRPARATLRDVPRIADEPLALWVPPLRRGFLTDGNHFPQFETTLAETG
jgi:hypothetical protein